MLSIALGEVDIGSIVTSACFTIYNMLYFLEIKDFTKERVISRVKELKKGKKLYDDNEKLSAGPKNHYKASYSKDGHNFWKISKFIIEELENLLDK